MHIIKSNSKMNHKEARVSVRSLQSRLDSPDPKESLLRKLSQSSRSSNGSGVPTLLCSCVCINLMIHIPVLVTSLIITTETSVLSQTLECSVTECVREERKLAHHDKALNNKSSLKYISSSSLGHGEKYTHYYFEKHKAGSAHC